MYEYVTINMYIHTYTYITKAKCLTLTVTAYKHRYNFASRARIICIIASVCPNVNRTAICRVVQWFTTAVIAPAPAAMRSFDSRLVDASLGDLQTCVTTDTSGGLRSEWILQNVIQFRRRRILCNICVVANFWWIFSRSCDAKFSSYRLRRKKSCLWMQICVDIIMGILLTGFENLVPCGFHDLLYNWPIPT